MPDARESGEIVIGRADRGAAFQGKRRDHQRLTSLRHYILIAQDAPRIEAYTRGRRGSL